MTNTINFEIDPMSQFSLLDEKVFSTEFKAETYLDKMVFGEASEKLSGKRFTKDQTVGTSLLVASAFFGFLALMFPYASAAYTLYLGLSMSSAVAGGMLLAPEILDQIDDFRNATVEIPLADVSYF